MAGRPSKYETHVQPYLDKLPEWYRTMTDRQICEKLGISKTAFYQYKADHKELRDAMKKSAELLVDDLKSALKQRALGYMWEEVQVTESMDADGNLVTTTKRTNRHVPADLGSIHLLLKNLDPEWRNDDATTLRMKREELDIKRQRAEADNW